LVGNERYPRIVQDFEASIANLPPRDFLGH